MTPALSTLDDVAVGTDLTIQVGTINQRWRVVLGGLSQVTGTGEVTDLVIANDMFRGYVRDGLVYQRDVRPAEVGEWFHREGNYWYVLVTRVHDGTVTAARWYRDQWRDFANYNADPFIDEWRRCDPPEVAARSLLTILQHFETARQQQHELLRYRDNIRTIREELNIVVDYATRARNRLGATNG